MKLKKKFVYKGIVFFPEFNSIKIRGQEKKIEPRLMKLFLMLYAKRGRVVSKQEIMDHVWAEKIVTDDSLTHAISQLRKLFAAHPVKIDTVRGVGYKLNRDRMLLPAYFDIKTVSLLLMVGLLLYVLLGSGLVAWVVGAE